jgi:hypothetical protein
MRLTCRLSKVGGKTWPIARALHERNAEYSDLVALPTGEVGCRYERDGYRAITFAHINLYRLIGECSSCMRLGSRCVCCVTDAVVIPVLIVVVN